MSRCRSLIECKQLGEVEVRGQGSGVRGWPWGGGGLGPQGLAPHHQPYKQDRLTCTYQFMGLQPAPLHYISTMYEPMAISPHCIIYHTSSYVRLVNTSGHIQCINQIISLIQRSMWVTWKSRCLHSIQLIWKNSFFLNINKIY